MNKNLFFYKGSRSLILLVPIFIILSMNFISAAQNTFISTSLSGCEIAPIIRDTLETGQGFDFNFHVTNYSNGAPLSNTSLTCVIHLYNQTGDHYGWAIMKNDPYLEHYSINEWAYRANSHNFTTPGSYAYWVGCNGTIVGGCQDKGSFTITTKALTGANNPNFWWFILALCIFAIALGFIIKNGWITILGSFGLTFVGLYIIRFGINGIKDNAYTWALGLITLMVAIYIMVKSSHEMIEDIDLR